MRRLIVVLSVAVGLALLLQAPAGAFHWTLRIQSTASGTHVETTCPKGRNLRIRQGSRAVTLKTPGRSFNTTRLNTISRSSGSITATCGGHPLRVERRLARTGLPILPQAGIGIGLLVTGALLLRMGLGPPGGPPRRKKKRTRRAPVKVYAQ